MVGFAVKIEVNVLSLKAIRMPNPAQKLFWYEINRTERDKNLEKNMSSLSEYNYGVIKADASMRIISRKRTFHVKLNILLI